MNTQWARRLRVADIASAEGLRNCAPTERRPHSLSAVLTVAERGLRLSVRTPVKMLFILHACALTVTSGAPTRTLHGHAHFASHRWGSWRAMIDGQKADVVVPPPADQTLHTLRSPRGNTMPVFAFPCLD
eukprot:1279258-Prymnesium_polylepis.2